MTRTPGLCIDGPLAGEVHTGPTSGPLVSIRITAAEHASTRRPDAGPTSVPGQQVTYLPTEVEVVGRRVFQVWYSDPTDLDTRAVLALLDADGDQVRSCEITARMTVSTPD